jgi:hypothetical protein
MSKFGAHITNGKRNGFGAALQKCAEALSPVPVLFALDQNVYNDVATYSPETVLIYRTQPRINGEAWDNPPGMYNGDPVAMANYWYALIKPNWLLNRAHYYAPSNERNPLPSQDAWIDAFDLRMMQLAEADGFKLALHGDSLGTPELTQWRNYTTSLRHAAQHGHIITLHEPIEGNALAFRYRAVHDITEQFAPGLKIAISECYGNLNGNQTQYVQSFYGYDARAMQDPYLIGFCAYQLGGDETWSDAIPLWADYVSTHRTPIIIDPPPPDPVQESYNGACVGAHEIIIDANGSVWWLDVAAGRNPDAGYKVMRDSEQYHGGLAEMIMYNDRQVLVINAQFDIYRALPSAPWWVKVETL